MNWYDLTPDDLILAGVRTQHDDHNPLRFTAPDREPGFGAARRTIIRSGGQWYVLDLWDPSERTNSVRLYHGRFVDRQHYLNTLIGIGWTQ